MPRVSRFETIKNDLTDIEQIKRRKVYMYDINNEEVYEVVSEYTRALGLLDDYDHQCLDKPKGSDTLYHLSYDECRKLIDSMKFNSEVFIWIIM